MNWIGGGHMGFMWIFWLVAIVGVVSVIYWISKPGIHVGKMQQSPEQPEQILKRRYANGEIDRIEYEKKLEDIRR